jgi:hypothetical protein
MMHNWHQSSLMKTPRMPGTQLLPQLTWDWGAGPLWNMRSFVKA